MVKSSLHDIAQEFKESENKDIRHKDIKAVSIKGNKAIRQKGSKADNIITGRPKEWEKNNMIQVRWYLPEGLIREISHYIIDSKAKKSLFTDIVTEGFKAIRQKGNK